MTATTTSVLESHQLPQGRKRASFHKEILLHIENGETSLARFIRSYLATALSTSLDDDDTPLDRNFTISDIAPESLISAWVECSRFCDDCTYYLSYLGDESNGRYFWLTRNRHGNFMEVTLEDERAGYAMQQLADTSHSYGEVDLYIGDSRKLHFSNERRVL